MWAYEPPFAPTSTPVNGTGNTARVNIADLIPSLEDDPKARFLDELALNDKPEGSTANCITHPSTSAVSTTSANAQPLPTGSDDNPANGAATSAAPMQSQMNSRKSQMQQREAKEEETQRRANSAALAHTSYEEYWERLGFRQECAQDTTGFFSCVAGRPSGDGKSSSAAGPGATDTGNLEPSSENDTASSNGGSTAQIPRTSNGPHHVRHPDPAPQKYQLPYTIVERLHKALLNTDFSNRQLAEEGSVYWMDSMQRIVGDQLGAEGLAASTGTVPAKDPTVGLKEAEKRAAEKVEAVTVLQPRKKKRM